MFLIQSANLALRFLLELCALAALAYWGAQTGRGPVVKIGLGIGAPLLGLELLLVLGGAYLYYRGATRLSPDPSEESGEQRRRVVTSTAVVTALMLLALLTDVLGVG